MSCCQTAGELGKELMVHWDELIDLIVMKLFVCRHKKWRIFWDSMNPLRFLKCFDDSKHTNKT